VDHFVRQVIQRHPRCGSQLIRIRIAQNVMKITHCGPALDVPRILTPAFAPLPQQCSDPPHVSPALLPGDGPLRKRTPGRPGDPRMEFAHTCLPVDFGVLSIIRRLLKE
jgi:hypothetical protein